MPFWTYFPTQRAAEALEGYLDRASYDEIDVLLFSHGVASRGLAGVQTWQRLADRAKVRGRLVGVDEKRFPADFTVFARYAAALRRLPDAGRPFPPLDIADALSALDAASAVSVGTPTDGRG